MTIPTLGIDLDLTPGSITSIVVLVDAATAAKWLEHNTRNRPLHPATVARYRHDMTGGRWSFAADPIRFDINGNLVDGQHRLSALAELPDVSLPMLVVRGLPTDAQLVMDQGRKRTPGQQLALLGVKDANIVAAAVKHVLLWDTGLMFRDTSLRSSITTTEIEAYVDAHPDDVALIGAVAGICRSLDAPPSLVVAFAIIAARAFPEEVRWFLNELHEMDGASKGQPVHTLDKRLRSIRKQSIRFSDRDYLALFIQAFNAYLDDRQIHQFLRPKGGSWTAETFPRVMQ